MPLVDLPWMTIGLAFLAMFAILWMIYLVLERDPVEAASKSTDGILGTLAGAGTIVIAIAVEGLHFVAEIPGLVIGLLGIAGIAGGWSWEGFAAVALLTYIVLAAIDPSGVRS